MIFTKFQSLTHKIDTMIIHDIKREMPLKYGLYRVAKWFAWLAHTGIFCTFIIYVTGSFKPSGLFPPALQK